MDDTIINAEWFLYHPTKPHLILMHESHIPSKSGKTDTGVAYTVPLPVDRNESSAPTQQYTPDGFD